MAALFNALKIVGKPIESLRVLMVGLGAAGVAVTKMMLASGVTHIVGCDRQGALSTTRPDYESGEMSAIKRWYAESSNPDHLLGQPDEVIEGMDLFVGLSGPGIIVPESLGRMSEDAIVFAMANPNPEVMPEDAAPYVRIMATGRSDYPNQINNVLCFPGIFRGALDAGAPRITEEMKLAAAQGIAGTVTEDDLSEDYIIPSVFNRDVAPAVAAAVVQEAKSAGIARFSDQTGTFQTVPREGPGHRRQRRARVRGLRRAARPRGRGRRADPRPRAGTRDQPHGALVRLAAADGAPPGRGLRRGRRGDQPGR